jgi:hypothetical protein
VVAVAASFAIGGCAGKAPPAEHTTPATTTVTSPATSYPERAPFEAYMMERDAEVELARTAAPAPISKDATVLVLTRAGYERASEGKNGFVCMVERSWLAAFDDPGFWNPKGRGPVCLNAPAVRSALPVNIKRTELALAGLSKEQMLARLRELVEAKAFPALEVGSMSYMLSKQQYLNDAAVHWHPHLMFYMPGDMDASQWGANLPEGSAVYGGAEKLPGGGYYPWTIFFVPVPNWSDGTPFEPHPRS